MSTSLHEANVRFATSMLAVDRPVDTSLAQAVSNNALHLADSCGQVLVAWNSRVAATDYLPFGSNLVNTYVRMAALGPFFLRVRGDTPYPLRVRIAGLSSDNVNTVTFAVRLAWNFGESTWVTPPDTNWVSASTSSSASAWLTAGSTLLSYTREDSTVNLPLFRRRSARIAIGGATGDVDVFEAYLVLYGQTSNVASEPRATGLYVAEYVGT